MRQPLGLPLIPSYPTGEGWRRYLFVVLWSRFQMFHSAPKEPLQQATGITVLLIGNMWEESWTVMAIWSPAGTSVAIMGVVGGAAVLMISLQDNISAGWSRRAYLTKGISPCASFHRRVLSMLRDVRVGLGGSHRVPWCAPCPGLAVSVRPS
ncbi:hypothetical protein BC834DRAFT_693350 [Gloeopeniophorella convolvens]|nr:hypothetical protein BC834DRAFT_693350 [Gloeopeniophorella convolvens]